MPYLRALGCHLPSRVVGNAELAALVGADPAWLLQATGIEERRFASPEESVATLGASAAKDCLESAGVGASEVGLILVSSGSSGRRFPGPATAIGSALGIAGTPAIDLPLASAGSLFGLAMAAGLCRDYGNVLVIGTEIMSRAVRMDPAGRDTAILFGDGAGACLVSAETGFARIADSVLHSDGEFAEALRLDLDAPLHMDGRTIILQASRKLPRVILEVLERNQRKPGEVGAFLMHQANLNLITRMAQALGVPASKFFRNVSRYGNTSSASLLIAAAEWWRETGPRMESPIVLAAFGAGLNWGAVLALPGM
ncbi:3-oxoacyl-(Acyl-carrier-protein) synthase [Candidatus Sulfopaludibacter sp. SbA4]|nr:3-oxoacyl-(Acyl-carrier-protein) synthase [Candidatus Sulfopaludibacter sp. SbA4]